jgi:hypothetical protein
VTEEAAVETPDPREVPDGDLPDSAMDTDSEAGSPGERTAGLSGPVDEVAAAVADDAPLRQAGGDQGDGLAPPFSEAPGSNPP